MSLSLFFAAFASLLRGRSSMMPCRSSAPSSSFEPSPDLDQAEAERVERLVGDVVSLRELLRDRVALRGEPRELLEHRIVGARRAQDALAGGLEREQREEEALVVVDRGVEIGARAEQRLERAERLDRLAGLAQALRALEQQLDVLGRRDVGDQLGEHALEHDRVGGRLALEVLCSHELAQRARRARRSPGSRRGRGASAARRRSGARPARPRSRAARATSGSTASGAFARPRAAASRAVGSSPPSASTSALTADAPPPAGSRSIASFCAATFFDFASAGERLRERLGDARAAQRVDRGLRDREVVAVGVVDQRLDHLLGALAPRSARRCGAGRRSRRAGSAAARRDRRT